MCLIYTDEVREYVYLATRKLHIIAATHDIIVKSWATTYKTTSHYG